MGMESAFSFSCIWSLDSFVSLTSSSLTRRAPPILRAVLLSPVDRGMRVDEAAGVEAVGKAMGPDDTRCNERAVLADSVISGTLSERESEDRREGTGDSKAGAGDACSDEDVGGLDEPMRTHSPI